MKELLKISIGVLTGITGFLEAGSLGTTLQAGGGSGSRCCG